MICLYNPSTNPYFNLATEEYLLKNRPEEIFMLWRNEPAIIVGRFQNTLAEINLDYVKANNIKVVRRMTGGGAVFHDLGNLNYTFIANNTKGDFRTYTAPILKALQHLGVEAQFEGRNDLTINGQKISGNAECVHAGRMLHHGTLLFSSEMSDLVNALKVNPLKFKDKAVKSVRKRVTNIAEHLPTPMSVLEFADYLMQQVSQYQHDGVQSSLGEEEVKKIEQLEKEKYATWEWNFGNAPKYDFVQMGRTSGGNVEVQMSLEKSMIKTIRFYGDFFSKREIAELENLLIGMPHQHDRLSELLESLPLDEYMLNVKKEDLLGLLF